jgi:hypothetical protein
VPSLDRRLFLAASAGAAMSATIPKAKAAKVTYPEFPQGEPSGKGPGDFDFLTGEWRIELRNFDTSGPKGREVKQASATVHRVLDGAGSIEELRRGDGSMWGMGVRVWLPEQKKWADHWTSAQNGVVNPPQLGTFIGGGIGGGLFLADDEDEGKPVKVRAVWDKITPTSCRWYQCLSRDGGKSWEYGYYMDWARVR